MSCRNSKNDYRIRQIEMFKKSIPYLKYIETVPITNRNPQLTNSEHPVTPDHKTNNSNRAFEFDLKKWKRTLHSLYGENQCDSKKNAILCYPLDLIIEDSSFKREQRDEIQQSSPYFFIPLNFRGDPKVLYSGENIFLESSLVQKSVDVEFAKTEILYTSRSNGIDCTFAGDYSGIKTSEKRKSRAMEKYYNSLFPESKCKLSEFEDRDIEGQSIVNLRDKGRFGQGRERPPDIVIPFGK
eukprot:GDKJ01035346.1.p1 GENE.GDKJ01035346.1~~GDKJ01035346.1.p1  ORF type:complete len:240 (+),score=14.21 GDKJ01035346.1:33-752(+)